MPWDCVATRTLALQDNAGTLAVVLATISNDIRELKQKLLTPEIYIWRKTEDRDTDRN